MIIFQEPSVFLPRTANSDGGVGVLTAVNLPVVVLNSPKQAGIAKFTVS